MSKPRKEKEAFKNVFSIDDFLDKVKNIHTAVAKCVAVAYGISGTGVSVARQLK